MDQFAMQHPWCALLAILIISTAFCVCVAFAFGSLGPIGKAAFTSGSNPQAPDSFGVFAVQFARMVIVCLILLATVVLAAKDKLTPGPISILSGVAGYVLGGIGPERARKSSTNKETQKTGVQPHI
jgi:hypothetical protein